MRRRASARDEQDHEAADQRQTVGERGDGDRVANADSAVRAGPVDDRLHHDNRGLGQAEAERAVRVLHRARHHEPEERVRQEVGGDGQQHRAAAPDPEPAEGDGDHGYLDGEGESERHEVGHGRPFYPATGLAFVLAFVVAPLLAVGLAVTLPVTCAVLAVALFGVAHLGLETRYVAGRFSLGMPAGVLVVLLLPLTLIALARLAGLGAAGTRIEVAVAFAVLGVAWAVVSRAHTGARGAGLAVAGVLATLALARPDLYLVAVAQLHNLVPLAFLLDWSRGRGSRAGRTAFRLAQLGWAVFVPLLILGGRFDQVLEGWGALAWGGDRSAGAVAATYSPAGWAGPWPARFLAVFAFGQLMHYVVWCGFLPVVGAREHRAAARAPLAGPVFRAGRFAALVAGAALVVGALQLLAGAEGRRVYSALASYHVYLEYPILVLLLAGLLAARTPRENPWPLL